MKNIYIFLLMFALIESVIAQPTVNFIRGWDMQGGEDVFTAVAVSTTGSIYAVGWSKQTSSTWQFVMIKYYGTVNSPTSNHVFTSTYDNGTINKAWGVAVKGPYYYVTGRQKSGSYYRIAVAREDTTAANQKESTYHHESNSNDYGQFVLAGNGSGDTVYVGGTNRDASPANSNVILLKYASTGTGLSLVGSAVIFDGYSANYDDTLKAMAIDADNNIYIASKSWEGALNGDDYYVAKFNRYLVQQWKTAYHGSSTDEPNAIKVDASGNVYVTGTSGSNAVTVKYNSSGTQQWASTYTNAIAYDIAVANSQVYVTGRNLEAIYDAVTIKYNASGTQQWADVYSPSGNAAGYKIKIDNTNNAIYVGGGVGDILLIKYDSSGTRSWTNFYNGPYQRHDGLIDMAADANGNIISAGYMQVNIQTSPDDQDFQVVSFNVGGGFPAAAQFVNPALTTEENLPSDYDLSQNYPNPFNPLTKIRYYLPQDGNVVLKIYDMLGREVKTILDGQQILKGSHEVTFDASSLASGAYFYRIMVGRDKYSEVKRMMLIK